TPNVVFCYVSYSEVLQNGIQSTGYSELEVVVVMLDKIDTSLLKCISSSILDFEGQVVTKEDVEKGASSGMVAANDASKASALKRLNKTPWVATPSKPGEKSNRGASNEELKEPMEDQPLPADASPTALSPGYVVDSNPEKDEKDPKEDPAYYPADRGNNDDDESSNDDYDDDDVKKDKEEEEHLVPADPSDVSTDDLVLSS
nr:hypothetical protein [Tanacetum cinerariifolium]